MSILDVVDAIRDLLEPVPVDPDPGDPIVERDVTGAKPFIWAAGKDGTFYVYPTRLGETPIETGPVVRQDFGIAAVFVLPSAEEPSLKRDADLSAALDAKLGAYLAAVRTHHVTTLWGHLRAAMATPPRTLQTRAVALDITGYRLVG